MLQVQVTQTQHVPAPAPAWRKISDIYTLAEAKQMMADLEDGRTQGHLVCFPNYAAGFHLIEGQIALTA